MHSLGIHSHSANIRMSLACIPSVHSNLWVNISSNACRKKHGKVLAGAAWLQSHVFVLVKSGHGKKQSMAPGSGDEASEDPETDKQLCLDCL